MKCPSLADLHDVRNAWSRCPDCGHVLSVHGNDEQCDLCALAETLHARYDCDVS